MGIKFREHMHWLSFFFLDKKCSSKLYMLKLCPKLCTRYSQSPILVMWALLNLLFKWNHPDLIKPSYQEAKMCLIGRVRELWSKILGSSFVFLTLTKLVDENKVGYSSKRSILCILQWCDLQSINSSATRRSKQKILRISLNVHGCHAVPAKIVPTENGNC